MAFPWAVLRQNNTTDLITGAGQYQVMSGGYYLADVYENFAPLTDFIKKSDYAKGMIPGLMEPGRSEWYDGQQVGIPFGIDAYGLMVNKDILAKAGVEPKFATWDDVIAACEKIEQAERDVACLSHSTGNPEQIGAFFFSAYDGPYVTKDGKYALDPAKAAAAAALLPRLWKHLPPGGQALTFDEAERLFADGKAAMLVDWPSFSTKTLDDPAKSKIVGKWTHGPLPGRRLPLALALAGVRAQEHPGQGDRLGVDRGLRRREEREAQPGRARHQLGLALDLPGPGAGQEVPALLAGDAGGLLPGEEPAALGRGAGLLDQQPGRGRDRAGRGGGRDREGQHHLGRRSRCRRPSWAPRPAPASRRSRWRRGSVGSALRPSPGGRPPRAGA